MNQGLYIHVPILVGVAAREWVVVCVFINSCDDGFCVLDLLVDVIEFLI